MSLILLIIIIMSHETNKVKDYVLSKRYVLTFGLDVYRFSRLDALIDFQELYWTPVHILFILELLPICLT